ncbi:hypothetical protein BBB50_11690 [Vibrio cholerae 2740-80]|uniref:Uncharacterized protein n=4 Tax=Vibrio cholerae TaxID=666 RepID=Q9KUF2_VIBCH|nr:hypothetical protein VC_0569 [Vibrio cholerae O1 biovar El Tor str. N16961]ACP04852.1 conserved hypothetical protein [Vibrio cholerae M66-2]ACP08605.1 conserved hypothetical protein [Vibrio cholerae O395]ANR88310.1 hypothetical protein BBB50_11690 [Vibrio cholerae 2740-80]ATD23706.1 hypothetical protein AN947_08030 [Vibrio cholerae]EET24925.1 conserved hypothetical protein [Vibrio cholerae MO10]KFZ33969.1 hypothetical protein KV36_10260 [Vibrio cholerae O1 biovar El Tor]KNA44608.1 hypothe
MGGTLGHKGPAVTVGRRIIEKGAEKITFFCMKREKKSTPYWGSHFVLSPSAPSLSNHDFAFQLSVIGSV